MTNTKQVTKEMINTEEFTSDKIDTSFWIRVVWEPNADVSGQPRFHVPPAIRRPRNFGFNSELLRILAPEDSVKI